MKYRKTLAALLVLLSTLPAFGQGTVLQGGARTAGHVPMYVGTGSGGQTTVQDSGPASGGAVGLGISELGLTARGTGSPPFAGQGTGPFGTNLCDNDAPITNPTGYHYFCFSPNAQGGGLIAYGNAGGAAPLPLQIIVNGTAYPFPFSVGGIVGPGTTVVGDLVLWNNTTGTLVKDSGFGINGIDANVLNTQTTNYTIAASDCGHIIQAGTGSTGLFTLTLPSTSGFAPTCVVAVQNSDTARGKVLSGFPADFGATQNILWPNQFGTVRILNGAWHAGVNPGRWRQTSAISLNVDPINGSDTGSDGLATSGPGAFKTIKHAADVYRSDIIVPVIVNPTIQIYSPNSPASPTSFSESSVFLGPIPSGSGVIAVVGNNAQPGQCIWTGTNSVDDGFNISLQGCTLRSAGTFMVVAKFGLFVVGDVVYGAAAANVQVGEGGRYVWDGGVYQVGEAACAPNCFSYHIINSGGGVSLNHASGATAPFALNIPGTFYDGFSSGSNASITTIFTGTGSGAGSTGIKYLMSNLASGDGFSPGNAAVNAGLPGATAGSILANACLDGTCAKITTLQFPTPVSFSSLPTCDAAHTGAINGVTDSSTVTWGANIAGGSTNNVLGYCNGANWTVAAK